MKRNELELFLFEDIESMITDTNIYPIYIPRGYKEYEQMMNELFGGDCQRSLNFKLSQLGMRLKDTFPMIADVCLDEASRSGEKPWMYLTTANIDIGILQVNLMNMFREATKNILKMKNKSVSKSEAVSINDTEIDLLIEPLMNGIKELTYHDALECSEVVENKRLVEGIIVFKIASLGKIPINIKNPNTKEVTTRHLKFTMAYEQGKHVAISECFTSKPGDKKVRMHSFILSTCIVNKLKQDYLSINISRRTWSKEAIPRRRSKNSSSLYNFTSKNFAERLSVKYNPRKKKFEFKNHIDEMLFEKSNNGIEDVDDIFKEPSEFGYKEGVSHWWGIPYDVQNSSEKEVKRGVAHIEKEAFKNMFEDILGFKAMKRLELRNENKYVELQKSEVTTLANKSSMSKLNLQFWGDDKVFSRLCDLIEVDSIKYEYSESIEIYNKIINDKNAIELPFIDVDSEKQRDINSNKKNNVIRGIEEFAKIRNHSCCVPISLKCTDEDNNFIFGLYMSDDGKDICYCIGDKDLKSMVKDIRKTVLSSLKVITRDNDKCEIIGSFEDGDIGILMTSHNGDEFAYDICDEEIISRKYIINKNIDETKNEECDRIAALIELENYGGSEKDPKKLIRYAFGENNIKTQFIIPSDKGLDNRLYACIADILFKEGVFKRNYSLESIELYTYLEHSVLIDAKHTSLIKNPDNKIKKISIKVPIIGKLSGGSIKVKLLNSNSSWIDDGDIYKVINEYIANYIANPSFKGKDARKADIEKIYKEIESVRDKEKEAAIVMSDIYVKDFGDSDIESEYSVFLNDVSVANNVNLVVRSSKGIVPGYLTFNKDNKVGVFQGYSVLKSEDINESFEDRAYLVIDKLVTTMKTNLTHTNFEKEKLFHQRNLIELRRFGEMPIEKVAEIYRESLKMAPTFTNMTNLNVVEHYLNKLVEYLECVEYNYSEIQDIISNN